MDSPTENDIAATPTENDSTATDFDAQLDAAVETDAEATETAEEQFEHDVDALLAERDQFKDIALRLQADFENFRKRVAQQQSDEVQRATGRLVEAMLPVLDAAEQAYLAHPAEVEPLFNLLLAELRKQGLEVLDLDGAAFDPAVAEAVLHEPGEGSGPVVAEVLRTGYLWKGKVLRAAMVKVRG
ncbi:MAG: nucleotide exchange factor GrpE [Actinomycetota bacterium]|nr:MAG: nucleotide exchange factor GrpE [Actinomycetota bacterium]